MSHDDSIILCLQTLPRALSAIDGRPAFLRDACPGHIVFKLPLLTDYIRTGSLKGPRPILFSNAPDISRGALAESKRKISKAKKGEMNFKSFFSPIQNSAGAISCLTQPSFPLFLSVHLFLFSRHRSHPIEDSGQAAAQQRSGNPVLHQAWLQRGDVPFGLRLQLHLPQPIQQEESGRDDTHQSQR